MKAGEPQTFKWPHRSSRPKNTTRHHHSKCKWVPKLLPASPLGESPRRDQSPLTSTSCRVRREITSTTCPNDSAAGLPSEPPYRKFCTCFSRSTSVLSMGPSSSTRSWRFHRTGLDIPMNNPAITAQSRHRHRTYHGETHLEALKPPCTNC